MKVPVSVVVITKNEERNIEDCLKSVLWADELIVVDDESRDKTLELAKKYTDRIFQRKMDIEGKHRNWAYAQARNNWVLSLDADEMASEGLEREIAEAISLKITPNGYDIPLRNYIGDEWIRHGGWYPARKLRLFKKDAFRYEEAGVHPRAIMEGLAGHLENDIIHKGYPDLAHFLDSLNRQTTLEAQKWVIDKRKIGLGKCLWRAIDRFLRSYLVKQGFKDGILGFMVACYASFYQLLSYAKYWELKKKDANTSH